jgi:hypothetical protein
MQPPIPFSIVYRRFIIYPAAHDETDFLVFTTSGVLYRPEQDITDPTAVDMSGMTLSLLPLLAWANYRSSAALQFHVSRFGAPTEALPFPPVSPLTHEITRTQLLFQPLTVVRVHGALAFGIRTHGVLQYALYAGVFAEETPHNLIAGASIGYAVGTTGFTLGIGYLYGSQAVGRDIFGHRYTDGVGARPGRDLSVWLYPLANQDRLQIENQVWYGVVTSEPTPLAVRIRSVLYINPYWTVYHRYDRLFLGQGLPKITEHIIGVRFLPGANVSLQAEVMMGGIDDAIGDAGGVRLAGTIYF